MSINKSTFIIFIYFPSVFYTIIVKKEKTSIKYNSNFEQEPYVQC